MLFTVWPLFPVYPRYFRYIRENRNISAIPTILSANLRLYPRLLLKGAFISKNHTKKARDHLISDFSSLPSDVLLLQGEIPQLPSARELNFRVLTRGAISGELLRQLRDARS
ncbi:hypothetical protein, partial [Guptibacillus hwajinpoensis]|uniref:hypothetical protein n=1 Tax=Guptibacillus hwajinpoensis TaxID=208199 RepID=UPI003735D0B6